MKTTYLKSLIPYLLIGVVLGTITGSIRNSLVEKSWKQQTGQQLRKIEARLYQLEHDERAE